MPKFAWLIAALAVLGIGSTIVVLVASPRGSIEPTDREIRVAAQSELLARHFDFWAQQGQSGPIVKEMIETFDPGEFDCRLFTTANSIAGRPAPRRTGDDELVLRDVANTIAEGGEYTILTREDKSTKKKSYYMPVLAKESCVACHQLRTNNEKLQVDDLLGFAVVSLKEPKKE